MLKFKLEPNKIIEKCNIGDTLKNGTPAKQYKTAKCLIDGIGMFSIETRSIAIKLFRKAADKGHVEAAYETYKYSLFDNWKETYGLKYLHFAAEKGFNS